MDEEEIELEDETGEEESDPLSVIFSDPFDGDIFQSSLPPVVEITEKTCTRCKETQPLKEFTFSATRYIRYAWCNYCRRDHNVTRNRATRVTVLMHYSGGTPVCACCGETGIEFLGIDHINGGGRAHRAQIKGLLWAWLKRNKYPEGFRVLCHNCNQALGSYGYCPHQGTESRCWKAFNECDLNAVNKGNKLTAEMVAEIRTAIHNGANQISLAAKYNVSRATICMVFGRKRWAKIQ